MTDNIEPRSLVVQMKNYFGYEQVIVLKREYDALTQKDREDLVAWFNANGMPTKL